MSGYSSRAAWIIFRRELRGELGLFVLAAVTMAVATAALTLVLSLAHIFEESFARSSKALIGGDLSLRLSQREFKPEERAWLRENSAAYSEIRAARVLAAAGRRTQIVRLKGVDGAYPLYGGVRLASAATSLRFAATEGGVAAAVVDQRLQALLGLEVGEVFTAAGVTLRVSDFLLAEPDPDPRLWFGAPPILVSRSVLEGDAFSRPGALVSRFVRVRLPAGEAPAQWRKRLNGAFPQAGWRVRGPENAQANVRRTLDRIRDFLALASLAAILLAGIGCGSALSAFLGARINAIAVLKMIGGRSALVRRVYFSLSILFAVGGALAGTAVGSAAVFVVVPLLSAYFPIALAPEWSVGVIVRSLFSVVAITVAFAAPPVLRFARVNPLALFSAGNSDLDAPPITRPDWLTVAASIAVLVVVLPLPWAEKAYLPVIAAVAAVFWLVAMGFIRATGFFARHLSPAWRLGILSIVRNPRQTAVAVLSLGLGLFILTAVLQTEKNFSLRIGETLKAQAPAVFMVGILPDQGGAFESLIDRHEGRLRTIPFLRARIVSIGGRSAKELEAIAPEEEKWILRGDRGITWGDGSYIGGSSVSEGVLWDGQMTGLQASLDDEAALAFGVELGDPLVLNVLGEPVTAVISSFRTIDWQTFDVNFVIILSGSPFDGVPHTHMGAAYLAEERVADLQLAISDSFPNVVPIATAPIFAFLKNLLIRTAGLLQSTALFLIFAGVPMVLAVLVENRRRRLQSAATLRLLGASQRTLIVAGVAEFLSIALLSVLPAGLLGALAGQFLVENIFDLEWVTHWGSLAWIAVSGVALFLGAGLLDIVRAARQAPFPHIRNE